MDLPEPSMNIETRFTRTPARYEPRLLSIQATANQTISIEQCAPALHCAAQEVLADIILARWVNKDTRAFLLLHEQIHAWQDKAGLIFHPLICVEQPLPLLSLPSHIRTTLFCEAMAAIESIRMAWNKAKEGDRSAWNGTKKHREWRDFARTYETEQSTSALWKLFFSSHLPSYYITRAAKAYHAFIENPAYGYHALSDTALASLMRTAPLNTCLALLPNELAEEYRAYETELLELSLLQHGYEEGELPPTNDLIRGSAAYWASQ